MNAHTRAPRGPNAVRPPLPRPARRRRGVTLVEMLVSVALLVLMMSAIVTIFAAATGAVSTATAFQELDASLRQLSATLRSDLENATATFTPPLNPKDGLGYFEYSEGQFSDAQGEDTDDTMRLTTRAEPGQFFTGRMYVAPNATLFPGGTLTSAQSTVYQSMQPITITSDTAEVIYFLRNGNLYRRVFLVAPQYQNALSSGFPIAKTPTGTFTTAGFGTVSWQGVNDLSARPDFEGLGTPILNTLADLTNRENRAFAPRFCDDYWNAGTASLAPDGVPDDTDNNHINDFYPTLYPNVFTITSPVRLVQNGGTMPATGQSASLDTMAFPFVYPFSYSVLDTTLTPTTASGPLHGLLPVGSTTITPPFPIGSWFDTRPSSSTYLTWIKNPLLGTTVINPPNHAALDVGDNLAIPSATTDMQTWWGYPTWKETMSSSWTDPFWAINANSGKQAPGLSVLKNVLLPPLTDTTNPLDNQPFNDGSGSTTFSTSSAVFRDDLLMTGVRSFDIKAYDRTQELVAGAGQGFYADLGYGCFSQGVNKSGTGTPYATAADAQAAAVSLINGFGHEGRIPPLTADFRFDPQYRAYPNNTGGLSNVGDDTTGLTRLRRVFDTWSTKYTQAPATAYDTTYRIPITGPYAQTPTLPYYPSYPAPYDTPLYGIQIQIRVVDPRNQHTKVLTIRQDFSDKLGSQ